MSFHRDSDDAELARTLQEQENFLSEEAEVERVMKLSAQEASAREALARTALSSTRTSAPPVTEGKSYNPPSTVTPSTVTPSTVTPSTVTPSTNSTLSTASTSSTVSTSSSTSLSRSSSSSSSSTSLSHSHSAKNTTSLTSPTTTSDDSLALARKLQEEEDLKFSRQLEEEQTPRRGRRQQQLSDDDLGVHITPTHNRQPIVHRFVHQPGSGSGGVSFVMSSNGTHMLPMGMQMQMQHSGGFPLHAMQQFFGGGMMPFPFQPSVDVDSMSYEELLELEERMGKVKRGATDEDITQLPTSKFRKKTPAPLSSSPPTSTSLPTSSIGASAFSTSPPKSVTSPTEAKAAPPPSEDKSCCICLEDFQDGEDIRRLPCFHIFHQDEIDKWLREHNSCPICKTPIPTSSSSSSS